MRRREVINVPPVGVMTLIRIQVPCDPQPFVMRNGAEQRELDVVPNVGGVAILHNATMEKQTSNAKGGGAVGHVLVTTQGYTACLCS